MITVYKYSFKVTQDILEISTHEGAVILTIQHQFNIPCLWAMVDTTRPLVKKTFYIIGTGNPIPVERMNYIATIQELGGNLVWHIFEKLDQ